MFVSTVPFQSLKEEEEQVVAIRREWVANPTSLPGGKGHWPRPRKCPQGLVWAGIPTSPHVDLRGEPGRFNLPVTQMSQHNCRERIIVEARWPIFNGTAQDEED